jgi:hypothetical protein
VFVFGIVEVLLCALKKYILSASLIILNSFVTNYLVIQNEKKALAGRPANLPTNGASLSLESKHLSWSALLLGGLKRARPAQFVTPI